MLFEKTVLEFLLHHFYGELTAKTILDKNKLYRSRSLETFQNIPTSLYLFV